MNKLNLIAIVSIIATVVGVSAMHISGAIAQGNTNSASAGGNASSGNMTRGSNITSMSGGGTTTSNVPSISSSSTSGY